MGQSKTVNLYLMNGEIEGIIKCSISNWVGVAYKIPRSALDECEEIGCLQQSGVYFLFGEDENCNQAVYVGQAGTRKNGKGTLLRIQEPHNSIEWDEVVVFTTTNNSFGPTEISYLENRFCNLALQAGRYKVCNANDPNPGNTTEETESSLEEFITYAKKIMFFLGHKVFMPIVPHHAKTSSQKKNVIRVQNQAKDTSQAKMPEENLVNEETRQVENNELLLYMEYKKGKAVGKLSGKGIVVLKGSIINPETTKSCPENILKARESYADKISDTYELTVDVPMSSSSAAAEFVGGASLSGNALWHDKNGIPLKQISEK